MKRCLIIILALLCLSFSSCLPYAIGKWQYEHEMQIIKEHQAQREAQHKEQANDSKKHKE